MIAVIEFLLVGQKPLGSALRAAVIGALAVTLGRVFFTGWWAALVFGLALVLIVLPLAYMLSTRDDDVDPYLEAENDRPPQPSPRDFYSSEDSTKGPTPGSML